MFFQMDRGQQSRNRCVECHAAQRVVCLRHGFFCSIFLRKPQDEGFLRAHQEFQENV